MNTEAAIFTTHVDTALASGGPPGTVIKVQFADHITADRIMIHGEYAMSIETADELVGCLTGSIREAKNRQADFAAFCERWPV